MSGDYQVISQYCTLTLAAMASVTGSEGNSFRKLYLCKHCNQRVSKTLYYRHKRLYYDRSLKSWQKQVVPYVEDDFNFSSGSDPEWTGM